jgi:hypothetical protein
MSYCSVIFPDVILVFEWNSYLLELANWQSVAAGIGNVAHVGDRKDAYGIWWGDLRERDHLEDLGTGGRIILKWVFKVWDYEIWTGLICLRIGTCGGCFWI